MSVTMQINTIDQSDLITWESLLVTQNLSNSVDTCTFRMRKYGSRDLKPNYNDDIRIYDGDDCVFGGVVVKVQEVVESGGPGVMYEAQCADYSRVMDKVLVARTYENQSIVDIITDMLASYAPDFDAGNVLCDFVVEKIVFNQVPISQAIKKLADLVQFDYYVDENKSVHFFGMYTKLAPFNLTDESGNYVYTSLERGIDGSQLVNRVKVRGGTYDGSVFTDVITVKGNGTKSFTLPYKMANLTIEVDTGSGYVSKNVGIDNIDNFTTDDVLYDFQSKSFRFENALSDGNKIRFSGNPKISVFAISEDSESVMEYGPIEKLIRDNSIQSNTIARKRATAELYAYAQTIVDAKFYTYNSGLRTGMIIKLSSFRRDCEDDLIIKTVQFKMIDPIRFGYSVECVSTKRYDFINLLQKILEPESKDSDEAEVSEVIYADNGKEGIYEDHEPISPQEDDANEGMQESHLTNPFNPATLIPVWGYYAPTSDIDPKRMFKWDRFKWLA